MQAETLENHTTIPVSESGFEQDLRVVLDAYISSLEPVRDEKNKYLTWEQPVKDFYGLRQHQPMWVSKDVLSAKGREMLALVANAGLFGLHRDLYQYDHLQWLADSLRAIQPEVDYQLSKRLETGLTKAFLQMALHLDKGMYADSTTGIQSNFWEGEAVYLTLLNEASKDSIHQVLSTLEPTHPLYLKFMAALRGFVSNNNISSSPIHIHSPKLDSLAAVADAKKALVYHHYLADTLLSDDAAFLEALRRFQSDNHLNPDGVIGNNTIKALERDNSYKFKVLAINADRWRRKETPVSDYYVWVNLPAFTAKIISGDTLMMQKKVIIGKSSKKHQTPELESAINQVVLWPTWTVPQSIIKHEMKSFKGYQVTRKNGYLQVVQPPGNKNALGAVKMLFPNKYSVYMHDTPTKSLFEKEVRAFSHGCVRCQDPLEIAAYLLERDSLQMPHDSLVALKERKVETKTFRLKKPVPVIFRYFTADAGFDGQLNFYADIYHKDQEMIDFIFEGKKPVSTKKAPKTSTIKSTTDNFAPFEKDSSKKESITDPAAAW